MMAAPAISQEKRNPGEKAGEKQLGCFMDV
jgi:hypothetical protein